VHSSDTHNLNRRGRGLLGPAEYEGGVEHIKRTRRNPDRRQVRRDTLKIVHAVTLRFKKGRSAEKEEKPCLGVKTKGSAGNEEKNRSGSIRPGAKCAGGYRTGSR